MSQPRQRFRVAYHGTSDGQSREDVLKHGIIQELHQAVAEADIISANRENSAVDDSLPALILILILFVVLLVSVGLLELLPILPHFALARSIDPVALLGVVIASRDSSVGPKERGR